jgi:hypothetical protein
VSSSSSSSSVQTTLGRVVLAGVSDGTAYLNDFCAREASPGGLGVLASLLAEVWDFDSDIASPASSQLNPSRIFGRPIRAYYQGNPLPPGAAAGSIVIDAQAQRWRQYVERGPADPKEVPSLPPERTNSNSDASKDGHDSPHRSPPTPPSLLYAHHLIRDFMFLDAAAENQPASGPPPIVAPQVAQQLTVQFRSLNPADFAAEDSALAEFTRGTGRQLAGNKDLLDIASAPVANGGDFAYRHDDVSFSTLLYELVDLQNNVIDGGQFSPNWFGVAVPDGITDFTNVVIYFHPTPGQAGYQDPDYASKTNGGISTHTYWKELLGYVDRLGSQLAGAVKDFQATPNQIVIVPLMRNQNVDGGTPGAFGGAGLLPRQWYYIVNDILKDLPTRLPTL